MYFIHNSPSGGPPAVALWVLIKPSGVCVSGSDACWLHYLAREQPDDVRLNSLAAFSGFVFDLSGAFFFFFNSISAGLHRPELECFSSTFASKHDWR